MMKIYNKTVFKYLILVSCYLALAWGIMAAVLYLFLDFSLMGILIGLFYPEVAPLLVLTYVGPTLVIIRLQFWHKWKRALIVLGICGFLMFAGYFQFFTAPFRLFEAEYQMTTTYQASYLALDKSNMLPSPVSLWSSVMGLQVDEALYMVQTNILYYNNGVDKFRFDYYKPSWGSGPFPVIINIHGGAWAAGGKGIANTPGFSKYMASKGYVVFDLNYGVYDLRMIAAQLGIGPLLQSIWGIYGSLLPIYNGSYTVEEQLENIGRFTQFLDTYNATYEADMSNVFVTGRSAGGHLAYMVGLGYKSPLFAGNFSSSMVIKGIFPFYGPTDMSLMRDGVARGTLGGVPPPIGPIVANVIFDNLLNGSLPLEQQYQKYSPAYLIQTLSASDIPPILIIHGEKDNLCPYFEQSWTFHKLALQKGAKCLFITIPGQGHAFDIFNFQSLGGQMSTYYIERFLALEGG